ncbi:MAG: outer membrane protein assembly factor BamD, partial [Candidatus Neomarinimicrobiota bacterium]|nr:outer membrane protein assembly factor BamD [Candidatus Neomarinimicrobiota bacterium]
MAIFFSFSIIFFGCSSNKFTRDVDYEEEYEKGKLALSNKKYVRAQDHFNTVVIGASHTELGDDALFYLGETYFYMGDKLLAISEYDKLIRRMSFSPYVERARYRICESYVTLSPKYFRDQTYSEKAIEKLQEFIDDYPNSDNREEAQKNIEILRNKLSRKIYDTGILYIKMEEYKAALIA